MKFKQSFIRTSLTPNQLKELENNFENNGALSPEVKGKLRGLKKSLLRFTVQQNQQQATAKNVLQELKEIKDRILKSVITRQCSSTLRPGIKRCN